MANILFFNISALARDTKQQTAYLCSLGHDVYVFTSFENFRKAESKLPKKAGTGLADFSLIITNVDVDELKDGNHIINLRTEFDGRYKGIRLIAFSGLFADPPPRLKAYIGGPWFNHYVFFPFKDIAKKLLAVNFLEGKISFNPGVTWLVELHVPKALGTTGKRYKYKSATLEPNS